DAVAMLTMSFEPSIQAAVAPSGESMLERGLAAFPDDTVCIVPPGKVTRTIFDGAPPTFATSTRMCLPSLATVMAPLATPSATTIGPVQLVVHIGVLHTLSCPVAVDDAAVRSMYATALPSCDTLNAPTIAPRTIGLDCVGIQAFSVP